MKAMLVAVLLLSGCATGDRIYVIGEPEEELIACKVVVKPPCVMGARLEDQFWAARPQSFRFTQFR